MDKFEHISNGGHQMSVAGGRSRISSDDHHVSVVWGEGGSGYLAEGGWVCGGGG